MTDKTKPSTSITGACGEHYVASYLSGFGLIVALPRAGVKGSDLFVAEDNLGHPLRVQVKTGNQCFGKDKIGEFYSWDTAYKVVERPDQSLWFAYLWLNGWPMNQNLPELFFVPSDVVIDHMKINATEKTSRTFFWMYTEVAEKFRGVFGLALLREAMKPQVA